MTAKSHIFCVIMSQVSKNVTTEDFYTCMLRTVDNASDWLIANLGTIMVKTAQYTYLSPSHPSTQVKVAR